MGCFVATMCQFELVLGTFCTSFDLAKTFIFLELCHILQNQTSLCLGGILCDKDQCLCLI